MGQVLHGSARTTAAKRLSAEMIAKLRRIAGRVQKKSDTTAKGWEAHCPLRVRFSPRPSTVGRADLRCIAVEIVFRDRLPFGSGRDSTEP